MPAATFRQNPGAPLTSLGTIPIGGRRGRTLFIPRAWPEHHERVRVRAAMLQRAGSTAAAALFVSVRLADRSEPSLKRFSVNNDDIRGDGDDQGLGSDRRLGSGRAVGPRLRAPDIGPALVGWCSQGFCVGTVRLRAGAWRL